MESMKSHLEFRAKYIADEKNIKVIKYDTDQQVKLLVVLIYTKKGSRILLCFRKRPSF